MKLRSQRIHHMGASNRQVDTMNQTAKNVFESSHMKSQSQYYKTAQSLPVSSQGRSLKNNPFRGTHAQQESLRWNSKAKRTGTETDWKLQPVAQPLDYSRLLNQEVTDVAAEFQGKDVNIFKLKELKRTFVKNNRKKRSLEGYFQAYAKDGRVGPEEIKQVVHQYGYDITDDEAQLVFKLTGAKPEGLNLSQFVELMTQDNVYFRTLKLKGASGQPRRHFQDSTHVVLRNKFEQLKEAFRIYRMRGEQVDWQKFEYVFKKLDINDLVLSKDQRYSLFNRFNDISAGFNVERLLCSVVEQEAVNRPSFFQKAGQFSDNLRVDEQELAKHSKKGDLFDFKRLNHAQYQNQLKKAQEIQKILNKLPQSAQLVANHGGKMSKTKMRREVEELLKSKGINFTQDDYDCFISYLDFNAKDQIYSKDFQRLLAEHPKQAQERFQRRLRALPPQAQRQKAVYDERTAIESLSKVKNKQLPTQMKDLFKQFDQDRDGFVSRQQLKEKIKRLAVLQSWEVDNLANYFDSSGNGYVTFQQFAKKYTKGEREPDNLTEPTVKSKSHSEWISTKRSFIKDANTYSYNVPSKYSAWPERLKRTDFSMIQPPAKAGQSISEEQRFNANEKHTLGQQIRQQKNRIYQNRLRKLVAWNQMNQQRINQTEDQTIQRAQANDYLMRLTKEKYEELCHQK